MRRLLLMVHHITSYDQGLRFKCWTEQVEEFIVFEKLLLHVLRIELLPLHKAMLVMLRDQFNEVLYLHPCLY